MSYAETHSHPLVEERAFLLPHTCSVCFDPIPTHYSPAHTHHRAAEREVHTWRIAALKGEESWSWSTAVRRKRNQALKFPPTLVARLHRLHHQRLGRCKDTIDYCKRWTARQGDTLPRPFVTHEDPVDERASERASPFAPFYPTPDHHHTPWQR